MADPHHVEPLDGLDRFTVRLYRGGIILAAASLVGSAVLYAAVGWGVVAPQPARALGWAAMAAGAALSAADVHLYSKHVRWVIPASTFLGLVLMQLAQGLPELAAHWVGHAGLGFIFVALSGFALKEQFCFRVPLLKAVPLFLALSLLPMLADQELAAAVLLAVAAMPYTWLAIAKLRMPLHFDIGDKSRYQI